MSLVKRLIQAVLATILVSVGIVTSADMAQAAKNDCSVGTFCIWSSTNYTGQRCQYTPPAFVESPINFSGSCDNNAASAYNRASINLTLFTAYNCNQSGSVYTILAGQSKSTFGILNDEFSSLCR